MRIIYSHRGFPTLMAVSATVEPIYESPEVSEIYRRRSEQERPNFIEELEQIVTFTKEWATTNGFFLPCLNPSVRISGGVQSFIAETALYLTKRITRRRMSFQDRGLFITPDSLVQARLPKFDREEMAAINELANMPAHDLIQLWVSTVGVDDLSSTFQLYVGDRTTRTPLQ